MWGQLGGTFGMVGGLACVNVGAVWWYCWHNGGGDLYVNVVQSGSTVGIMGGGTYM